MDPSRIRLEDDRFGLIGAAFRPGNRAVYAGRRGDDYVWSIGIIVGPEDDIQTVEIDDHGAKSSRMLSAGERFEGLDILAAPGAEAFIIAGTFTLMGMELSATSPELTREFADILRAAADDHSWRLPLRVVGHPRDLQLSAQGRDILRETAATLERDGSATTSLAAARRLELSEQALDSIRRRISRASLQAYRMHGRWYVVLDNLARSRATPSPVEEAPVEEAPEAEAPPAAEVSTEPAVEPEPAAEPSGAPTEDDLAAFAEPEVAEPEVAAAEVSEPEAPEEPSVEYVQEEPQEAPEAPVTAAEVAAPEPAEAEPEAAAPAVEAEPAPEIEEAAQIEELAAEQVREEPAEASVEFEEAPTTEPEMTEEYRAAATTPGPTRFEEFVPGAAVAETLEQPEEATVEEEAAEAAAEPEQAEAPVSEAEESATAEAEAESQPAAEAEAAPEVEPEAEAAPYVDVESGVADLAQAAEEAAVEPLETESAASIEEPVVAEDLSALEAMVAEEAAPEPESAAEEAPMEPTEEAPEPEAAITAEPEMTTEEPAPEEPEAPVEEVAAEEPSATGEETVETAAAAEVTVEESFIVMEEHVIEVVTAGEPMDASAEPEPEVEPDITEPVQSEEALLFAEMVEQEAETEPAPTELEADVAEQSDELIAERVAEAAAGNGEVAAEISAPADESESPAEETEAAGEPSDEVIAERIRTHVPPYADEIGRDELIDSGPAPESTETPESEPVEEIEAESVAEEEAMPEAAEAEAEATPEATEAEAEPTGGPSAASYFADARSGAGARQATARPAPSAEVDFTTHLRGEVAFLRQQSREKDRQIGVWGDGARWLQPFVDQIRSLEKQVERLGELHVQRENERVNDLVAERDALRQRLEALEAQINATQSTKPRAETNRRSWFRRMMGSE